MSTEANVTIDEALKKIDVDLKDCTASMLVGQLAQMGYVVAKLVPRTFSDDDDLEEGDDSRCWRGSFATYYLEDGMVVGEFGGAYSVEGARTEAGAILGAAEALAATA